MAHAMHIHALPPHYAAGPFDNDNGRLPPISACQSFSHHFAPPILAASSSSSPLRDSSAVSPSVIPAPMAIRGADRPTFVPPPLPPPRLVPIDGPVDPTLQSKEHERERMMREHNGSSGSWYPDSFGHSIELPPRRCDPFSPPRTELDEGYHSLDVSRGSELPSLLGSHPVNVFRPIGRKANHDIDNDMINKLNGRRSGLSASLGNMAPFTRSPVHVTPGGSSGLSLYNNNNRNSNNNNNGASPFGHRPAGPPSDHRPAAIGASNNSELERSPLPSMRRNDSNSFPDDATVSTQTSLEAREDEAADFLYEETRRVRRLDIGEGFNFSASGRDRDWEWGREREWQPREAERDPFCSRQGQAGQKRRASSPPSEEFVFGGNGGGGAGQAGPLTSDMVKRRDGGGGGLMFSRGSPTLRHPGMPQQPGDASSVGPTATSQSGSLSLTTGALNPNTSLFMRLSPPALSPGGFSTGVSSPVEPVGAGSPFSSLTSGLGRALQQQQQQSQTLPKSGQQHQLVVGEAGMTGASQAVRTVMTPPRKLGELSPSMSKHTAMKRKAPYMCECCPKKPKKFDTEEELSLHAAEKQYTCQYCGNRFKNKNEAERHQNSLHVRSHSWSCSALTARGYERAFHDSTVRPGEADVCGYCGDEFSRSGPRAPLVKMESPAAGGGATSGGGGGGGGGGGDDVVMGGTDDAGAPAETDAASAAAAQGARQVTEADWEKRMDHLQNVHKFRECNASKKFFRADHFRQHLKHSHGGTSGKWTNMLENACMTEEEPPTPLPTARA